MLADSFPKVPHLLTRKMGKGHTSTRAGGCIWVTPLSRKHPQAQGSAVLRYGGFPKLGVPFWGSP